MLTLKDVLTVPAAVLDGLRRARLWLQHMLRRSLGRGRRTEATDQPTGEAADRQGRMSGEADGRPWDSIQDPAGFVFQRDCIFSAVNQSYAATFDTQSESGMYARLTVQGPLVRLEAADRGIAPETDGMAPADPAIEG